MNPSELRAVLDDALRAAAIPLWGYVGEAEFRAACAGLEPGTRTRYGLESRRGAVAAALAYGEGDYPLPPWAGGFDGPRLRLARFARAHWYRELSARLGAAATDAAKRIGAADGASAAAGMGRWPSLANSGLPERRLALAAGLGQVGRNRILMARGLGSSCVLGLILLPFDPAPPEAAVPLGPEAPPGAGRPAGARGAGGGGRAEEGPPSLAPVCAGCRRCVEACPTGALDGGYDRERCLQHWARIEGPLPPAVAAAWGDRLYGCDSCLEACPAFKPDPAAETEFGRLGPNLPAAWLLGASDEEIGSRLRGSALGLGWISPAAFRRSAAAAMGRRI